jgi:hypothetical protein
VLTSVSRDPRRPRHRDRVRRQQRLQHRHRLRRLTTPQLPRTTVRPGATSPAAHPLVSQTSGSTLLSKAGLGLLALPPATPAQDPGAVAQNIVIRTAHYVPERLGAHIDQYRAAGTGTPNASRAVPNGGYTCACSTQAITLGDLLDRLLRSRAGGCQNMVLMPGAGSGILKTWKSADTRASACAPPWTCIT